VCSALGYGTRRPGKEAPIRSPKISDLQQRELFTAQAKEALDEAADRMNWHQVGTFRVFGASI
jgi:hypothetical protein